MTKLTLTLVASFAAAAALLSACASSSGSGSSSSTSTAAAASSPAATPAAATGSISTASGALGTYLVDGSGKSIYILTSDKPGGASACTTQCLTFWPPVAAPSPLPTISGATAKFATFTAADGSSELTINGYPAYTFKNDTAPGMTAGQGVKSFGGVWWLVTPSGSWITTAAASSSNAAASSSASKAGSGYGY
jgi:predicted lipoprotein with Yx(FWY)xxD motif